MPRAILVAGLGYGDEGKGSITDFMTDAYRATTVIRYNGGAQAAHNVVTPDKRHHTFAQFGSGTFHPGVKTFLSKFVLVNPLNIMEEENHLREIGITDAYDRLFIDPDALLITPFHIQMNKIREIARGDSLHGSCGQGIGETRADSLKYSADKIPVIGDIWNFDILQEKLRFIRTQKCAEMEKLGYADAGAQLYNEDAWDLMMSGYEEFSRIAHRTNGDEFLTENTVIFEGAQGVLLDETYGFQPYTTWTDTTFNNAYKMLESYNGEIVKVGVIRAYMTRHGAGPFVTEDENVNIPELHNGRNTWQHGFRAGHFDLVALKYALDVIGGVDFLALTHCDHWDWPNETVTIAKSYKYGIYDNIYEIEVNKAATFESQSALTKILEQCQPSYWTGIPIEEFSTLLKAYAGTEVGIYSFGPTMDDKVFPPAAKTSQRLLEETYTHVR